MEKLFYRLIKILTNQLILYCVEKEKSRLDYHRYLCHDSKKLNKLSLFYYSENPKVLGLFYYFNSRCG